MKIPFVDYNLYSKVKTLALLPNIDSLPITDPSLVIQTTSRSSVITNTFVGRIIAVHNGRLSKRILIKPEMVGLKLGCFVFTKKLGSSIHNSERNRKKKEKMRRKITQKKVRKTVAKTKVTKKPTANKKK